MEGTETLCPHATILNHRWLPGTLSRLLSGKPDQWMHLSPFYTRMHGEGLRYANSTSQYSLAFSLYRDDWGFQVNPLCRHDITSPFPPSGNEGYVRNRDVLTRTRKYDHISPVLSTLHWLTTKHRIDFKILLITYKALNGLAPQYLSELLSHYSPSRPLRSQNSGHLIIPRISKSTAGGRSFSYLVPKLWNNLPNTVREADTLCQFKSRLKTHLFNLAYT